MMLKKRLRTAHLAVEALEARECPAFDIYYSGGALIIRGTPTIPFAAPGDGININLLPGNLIQVQEVGNSGGTVVNYGAYRAVGNLILQTKYTNTDVNFNLNGRTLTSNVLVNLGYGDIDPFTINTVNVRNGTIAGNMAILGGAGIEIIHIGQPNILGPLPATIVGNLSLVGNPRQDILGIGDSLFIDAGSEIRGNLSAVEIDNVDIGEGSGAVSFVRGTVSQNVARSRNVGRLNIYGEVDNNVTFLGSNFLDTFFTDSVVLKNDNAVDAVVRGNLIANFRYGDAEMNINAGTTVEGNLTYYTTGSAGLGALPAPFLNRFIMAGNVDGYVRFEGSNGASNVIFPATGTILGNFVIRAGNEDNDLSTFAGFVGGSIYITLGSGTNTISVVQAPGGIFYWTSGNGSNSVTLGSGATPANTTWNVAIRFGTNDDTLTLSALAPATQYLTGYVRNEGSSLGDTFDQQATWELTPTLRLLNFS